MRTRKELIYLNAKDLTDEELDHLSDYDLNCCDICGEIDLSIRLHWIENEEFWDNEEIMKLVRKGNCAVCDNCLPKTERKEDVKQKILDLIKKWGGFDGGHHKQWLIDMIVREVADDYDKWVKEYESGEDGPETYKWDTGIAP